MPPSNRAGLPASWAIAREVAPEIADFLAERGAVGVAEAIRRALAKPPGIRAFMEESPAVVVWLSAEEASQVWELYENGREIASADV